MRKVLSRLSACESSEPASRRASATPEARKASDASRNASAIVNKVSPIVSAYSARVSSRTPARGLARRAWAIIRGNESKTNKSVRRGRPASFASRVGGGDFQGGVMKAEFHIDGMHCDSCAALIKETLEETAGVQSADVNFGGKTAVVDFDQNVLQRKTIIKKIQDLGYNATEGDQAQGATTNG